jgi:DNA-binding NtrC family response regulator
VSGAARPPSAEPPASGLDALSVSQPDVGETQRLAEPALEALSKKLEGPPRLTLVLDLGSHVEVAVLEPHVPRVLGRASPADLLVDDRSLSRAHARLSWSGAALDVRDLASKNGTFVRGERVGSASLAPGESFRAGGVEATLVPARPTSSVALASPPPRALSVELARARAFGRSFAVYRIVPDSGLAAFASRLRAMLRPFDHDELVSPRELELVAPELGLDQALSLGARLAELGAQVGLAVYPTSGSSEDALADAASRALASTTPESRCKLVRADEPRALAVSELAEPLWASAPMKALDALVSKLARTELPVLVLGETGTGKEVVARLLHERGPRRAGPLIAVNCGALARELVESTLFGHEKGAFTGAHARHEGVFEAARGGTVLLDEVGELPLSAQATLLRVLESKKVTRVGGTRELDLDARVVAATHRDLDRMVEAGEFRRDLLYRLEGVSLALPPLRERGGDVLALAERFLRAASSPSGRPLGLGYDVRRALERYAWPGNVRELKNAMERASALAEGPSITLAELPPRLLRAVQVEPPDERASARPDEPSRGSPDARAGVQLEPARPSAPAAPLASGFDLRSHLAKIERELLVQALAEAGGNQADAARRLGLPVRTLGHRLKLLVGKRG